MRLIHLNSSQALKFSGRQLPDWGFNQHEVVTDRIINQPDSVWNVEEHRYTKSIVIKFKLLTGVYIDLYNFWVSKEMKAIK